MNAEFQRVKELFLGALDRPTPAEREAYLSQTCGGDGALRRQVEALLRKHEQAGSFLELPDAELPLARWESGGQGEEGSPTVDEPITERPGTVIGPYKLLEQIGEGGFGVVFMADQTQPVRRKVALKLLKPGMDTRQVIARFEAERQALAIMDHPNIAKVFDGGATPSGRPFFVMELVKGVPITEYCDQNHLTPRQRLELFVSVCQAVQHAHQKGIIHRDVKPSNVLVTTHDATPVVKVIDFGVVKALGQELTDKTLFTGFAQLIGTPLYMSPEQAGQSSLDVDTRSDIYSLGVLLYELLTGTTPFDRARFKKAAYDEIRRIIREEEPPKPSTRLSTTQELPSIAANRGLEPQKLRSLVRGELDWIVMRCLEKDRNRRYETANGLAMDVQRHLNDEHVLACPPSVAYRLRKFVRRNKAALVMTSVIAAALSVAVIGLGVSNLRVAAERDEKAQALTDKEQALMKESAALAKAKEQERLAKDRTEEARQAKEQEARERRKAEKNLMRMHVGYGLMLMDRGDLFAALPRFAEALQLVRDDPQGERMHGLRLAAVAGECPRLAHVWFEKRVPPYDYIPEESRFSPDGNRLLTIPESKVEIRDVETGEVLAAVNHAHVYRAAFSRKGRWLVTLGFWDRSARVWDLSSGKNTATFPHAYGWVHSSMFSPDDRLMIAASDNQQVRVVEIQTGQPVAPSLAHPAEVTYTEFSPDGRYILTVCADDKARLWLVATGELLQTLAHQRIKPFAQFSPNSLRVVTVSGDGTARVWEVKTGRELATLTVLKRDAEKSRASFSPDSQRVVTSELNVAQVWDAATGAQIGKPMEHGEWITQVLFSPDGARVVTASVDVTARLWDAVTGEPLSPPLRHNHKVESASLSPDGRWLTTVSFDQVVRVWDLAPPSPALALEHAAPVEDVAFSQDGRMVVTASQDKTARVWNTATGGPISAPLTHDDWVNQASLSPDGSQAITAGRDGTTRTWSIVTGKELWSVKHQGPVLATGFSPDGRRVVTASADHTAQVWDAATGQPVGSKLQHRSPVKIATFSPGGGLLLTVEEKSDGIVRLWNAETGRLSGQLRHTAGVLHSAEWSRDGSRVATSAITGWTTVWDVPSGKRISGWSHGGSVLSAVFSPDGRLVLSVSSDGKARARDAETGEPVLAEMKHPTGVHWAGFSPDGTLVITLTLDNVAYIWNAATAEPLSPPLKSWGLVHKVVFHPDGRRVATTGSQGARIRELPFEHRPVEDVVLHAQILSSQEIASASEAMEYPPMTRKQLERAWKTLRGRHPK